MKFIVHDLEVMGSKPSRVELGVCSTSVKVILEAKIFVYVTQLFSRIMHSSSLSYQTKM